MAPRRRPGSSRRGAALGGARRLAPALALVAALAAQPLDASADAAQPGLAEEALVGVSWSNFQEERWKTDQAALEEGLRAGGARVLSADAQSSSEKQIADIESLITRGAQALIVVAHDADAVLPAIGTAVAEGIPVIGYDRLIEHPAVFYISFDNREVGRLQARAIRERVPRGRYVFIKGAPTDPNADLVHAGQLDELQSAIDAGEIEVVASQYVEGWLPEVAQRTMEQILTARASGVDAVVCSNDGMAGGVVAALAAAGLDGVPVSGQDGDHAALNRVARGLQTVSVWKDARALGAEAARVALALRGGTEPSAIRSSRRFSGGRRGVGVNAILLAPEPITRERLSRVIEAGWVTREVVCRGVAPQAIAVCP